MVSTVMAAVQGIWEQTLPKTAVSMYTLLTSKTSGFQKDPSEATFRLLSNKSPRHKALLTSFWRDTNLAKENRKL